jgi:GTP-binding protein
LTKTLILTILYIMKITNSKYIISSPSLESCPDYKLMEFAFIGRSNVGKSSLINYISNNGSLCKTSKLPGKTKLINHFLINNKFYFVDLPGYGYAKVSKAQRQNFGEFIENFITQRVQLELLFVLIDSSIEPQKIDLEFVAWLEYQKINYSIVFTKSDKQSKNNIKSNISNFQKAQTLILKEYKINNSDTTKNPYFIASSSKKIGSEDILGFISAHLK